MSNSDDKRNRGAPDKQGVVKGSRPTELSIPNEREIIGNRGEPKIDTSERARLVPIPPPPPPPEKGKE